MHRGSARSTQARLEGLDRWGEVGPGVRPGGDVGGVGDRRAWLRYSRPVRLRDAQHEQIEPQRRIEYRDPAEFDRIAFAMRALERLRPKRMTVAVYAATSTLRVESGRNLHRGKGGTWAIVGIPPHASREHIAYALAELAGVASVPYAVQMLLAAEMDAEA